MNIVFVIAMGIAMAFPNITLASPDPCSTVKREIAYGLAAAEDANQPDDFARAAAEFEKATTKAPKCAFAFYNMGYSYQMAKNFTKAKAAYERFLQLAPNDPDAEGVQQEIYKLEYRISRAAEENRDAGSSEEDNLAALNGNWTAKQRVTSSYSALFVPPAETGPWDNKRILKADVVISDERIIVRIYYPNDLLIFNGKINGQNIEGRLTEEDRSGICPHVPRNFPFNGKILSTSNQIMLIARGGISYSASGCVNESNMYIFAFMLSR